jgi:hypothetical protein
MQSVCDTYSKPKAEWLPARIHFNSNFQDRNIYQFSIRWQIYFVFISSIAPPYIRTHTRDANQGWRTRGCTETQS